MLALPNISSARRKEIIKKVEKHNLVVRTLPSMVDLAKGKIEVDDFWEQLKEIRETKYGIDEINRARISHIKESLVI